MIKLTTVKVSHVTAPIVHDCFFFKFSKVGYCQSKPYLWPFVILKEFEDGTSYYHLHGLLSQA